MLVIERSYWVVSIQDVVIAGKEEAVTGVTAGEEAIGSGGVGTTGVTKLIEETIE